MTYLKASIKEILRKINNYDSEGWFLPYTQRQYVWGSRYESEKYMCKLFDSIFRGYPIGTFLLWKTENEIPYREFATNYEDSLIEEGTRIVNEGKWIKKDKFLVYDGQQRLQTIYSSLYHTINGRILVFDLAYDMKGNWKEEDEMEFRFVEQTEKIDPPLIRMNELLLMKPSTDEKVALRKRILEKCIDLDDNKKSIIESNIDSLWSRFVEIDSFQPAAYYVIIDKSEDMVNEIFERLNTGGVQLSQADLLFLHIKDYSFNFEEKLKDASKKIYEQTANGYVFDGSNILQLIHLIVKGNVRVDPKKVKAAELKKFIDVWNELENPLYNFFNEFLWNGFHINDNKIIPKKLALLPLMVYYYKLSKNGKDWKSISSSAQLSMKQYFILSQINDWNLQSLVDDFTRKVMEKGNENNFPLDDILTTLEKNHKRETVLFELPITDYRWFSLKILNPDTWFMFEPDNSKRFNPEIDHIFPRNPEKDPLYPLVYSVKDVDIIWNMQPLKGAKNNQKLNLHPKKFFTSAEGEKYFKEYAFVPKIDDPLWMSPLEFIKSRKEAMKKFFMDAYKLEVKTDTQPKVN